MAVVRRVARILDFVCAQGDPPSLTEVAGALGEPRSSVHRMLAELVDLGLLVRLEDGLYVPGPRLVRWAQGAKDGLDFAQIARPTMEALRDSTGESVRLYAREGEYRVCIAAVEGTFELRHVSRVGLRLTLRAGAAGKLLLAYAERECQERELDLAASQPLSARAPTAEQLRQEIETIRATGLALSDSEREEGLAAAAVPIWDHSRNVIAALTISGPSSRLTVDRLMSARPRLEDAAQRISLAIGGMGWRDTPRPRAP